MANHEKEPDLEARFQALAETNAKLMAALEAKSVVAPSVGLTADQLTAILKETSKSSELLASKYKPEDLDPVFRGPFEHPLGGLAMPKPSLARETIFCGNRLRLGEITYAEVVAINALSGTLGRSQRRLARDGTWVAEVNDRNDRLTVNVPHKTMDDRADLPSMLEIIMELTSGTRALDQADILTELALLREQVASLKAVPA